jgi:serine/threonine-protein kinase
MKVRFEREVRNAERLDHLGCIRVLDHGTSKHGPYLVNELLSGPSLRQRLQAGKLSMRHAVRVGDEVLAALDHAHSRGIVHRDVKPENVMYRRRGVDRDVVLIDFGLARALGDTPLTQTGMLLGSPSYVAPERVLGRPGDHRMDLYAVAVVLYECLVGRAPYVASSPLGIARQHVEAPVPELQVEPGAVPPQLGAVIRRALAKDPADRYATAELMRVALVDAARATWEMAAIELDESELTPAGAQPPPLPPSAAR